MKGDRELCMAAVTQDREALRYVSEDMKGDRELCMAAVAQDGKALQWASEEMRGHRGVWSAGLAAKRNRLQLKDAPEEMKGDRELCMATVAQDWHARQPRRLLEATLPPPW